MIYRKLNKKPLNFLSGFFIYGVYKVICKYTKKLALAETQIDKAI